MFTITLIRCQTTKDTLVKKMLKIRGVTVPKEKAVWFLTAIFMGKIQDHFYVALLMYSQ